MNFFYYYVCEDVGREDPCVERSNVLKKLQVYQKAASENISLQPAKSKYICPKVRTLNTSISDYSQRRIYNPVEYL